MRSNEIKSEDQKALPKFLLILAGSIILGVAIGTFSSNCDTAALSAGLQAFGVFFGENIAPWLMLALATLMPVIFVAVYRSAKKQLSLWNSEDETLFNAIDHKLSALIWLSNAAFILSFSLFAATFAAVSALHKHRETVFSIHIAIAAFIAIMIEMLMIQQRCVDATKKMSPEKNVSIYDVKFQKKWMDCCDEAEKAVIGKCTLKAHRATSNVCMVLACVFFLCEFLFEIGFLPCFAVCLVWFIHTTVYCREAAKYSKPGRKIS